MPVIYKPFKVSIAMATYNGGLFLREQLMSFLAQTRLPEELVVCDDNSSDNTIQILKNFSSEASFRVRIHRNPHNLGYAQTFSKALELCRGDVIFLSDQDDFWFPEKIQRVTQRMEADEQLLLVINDAALTNEFLKPSGLTVVGQISNADLPLESFIVGSCSAISARLLQIVLPIPEQEAAHDSWIHRFANALDMRAVINEVLQYYRRHDSNTSQSIANMTAAINRWEITKCNITQDTRHWVSDHLKNMERCSMRLQTVIDENSELGLPQQRLETAVKRFEQERVAAQVRLYILEQPRLMRIFWATPFLLNGGYSRFSGWKSFLKDLIKS